MTLAKLCATDNHNVAIERGLQSQRFTGCCYGHATLGDDRLTNAYFSGYHVGGNFIVVARQGQHRICGKGAFEIERVYRLGNRRLMTEYLTHNNANRNPVLIKSRQ